jgi:hypothetical protein
MRSKQPVRPGHVARVVWSCKALTSLKVDMSKITKRIQKDPKGQCRLRKNINESSKKVATCSNSMQQSFSDLQLHSFWLFLTLSKLVFYLGRPKHLRLWIVQMGWTGEILDGQVDSFSIALVTLVRMHIICILCILVWMLLMLLWFQSLCPDAIAVECWVYFAGMELC